MLKIDLKSSANFYRRTSVVPEKRVLLMPQSHCRTFWGKEENLLVRKGWEFKPTKYVMKLKDMNTID
jgi:hypothetical protein